MAIRYGLYWFVFAEVIKVLMAAGVAARWRQRIESYPGEQRTGLGTDVSYRTGLRIL